MCASDVLSYASCADHLDGTGINAELEEVLATFTGFAHTLGMSSASTALDATYAAVGLSPGDEVIAPSFTAAETIAPLPRRGCIVVFADILSDGLTINPAEVERLITARTKGIVGVDIAGQPHDTTAIRAIAGRYGLVYIADCAQGFGACIDGKHAGYAADAAVLSLNAQKTLTAGEGGVLLTNNQGLYHDVLRETQHPHRQARQLGSDAINFFPVNGRLSALAARAAVRNLPTATDRIQQQRKEAQAIIALLNTFDLLEPITIPHDSEPTFPYLTAAWRGQPEPVGLLSVLHEAGHRARLRSMPIRPLHKHPQLASQFANHVRIPRGLPNTERATQRFCIHFGGTP